MVATICISTCKNTCSHFNTRLITILDPKNMGLEAIIFQLSVKLAKIMRIMDFYIMAS